MSRIGDFAGGNFARTSLAGITAATPGHAINASNVRAGQLITLCGEPAGGGGADTFVVKLQHSPNPVIDSNSNGYDGTDDGSRKLKSAAATSIEIATPFTTGADAITVWKAKLRLSKLGVPALAAGGIPAVKVEIRTDAAGSPNTAVATSRWIRCSDIGTSIQEITFQWEVGFTLTAATDYWLVLMPDYDADANNCIQWHYNTAVTGAKYYDAAWAVATNQDFWFVLEDLVFADAPTAAAPSITYTEGTILNLLTLGEGLRRSEINMEQLNNYIRIMATPSGGTWTPAIAGILGDPLVQPAV